MRNNEATKQLRAIPRGFCHRPDRSLCLFRFDHPLRVLASQAVQHPWFEASVLLLIFVSSILLAVDSPLLDPASELAAGLRWLDLFVTALFTLELTCKVVAFGLVLNEQSYLRSGWNILDGLIVMASLVNLFTSGQSAFRSIRSLRALRALRPLRVISRYPGLRLVVNALFRAIPSIVNVMFVTLLFFLIFGVLGTNYFKGSLASCAGPVFEGLPAEQAALVLDPVPFDDLTALQQASWASDPVGHPRYGSAGAAAATSKEVCEWLGAAWEPVLPEDFNNVGAAIATFFEIASSERWVDVMMAGVDSVGIDMQPRTNANPEWSLFFVTFQIVGSLFLMNMFVGTVVDNFNRAREETGHSGVLTPAQREWAKAQELLFSTAPMRKARPPTGIYRSQVYLFIHEWWFEPFVMACIILNTLVLGMSFYGAFPEYTKALETTNVIFAFIFLVEAALKITGLGWDAYWLDPWNRFDIVLVVLSMVGLILTWSFGFSVGSLATIIRVFRVGRVFRLVRTARSLRVLFTTLLVTLPSLANIGGLLFLLIFIYALMGMQTFAHVQFGNSLDDHANFRTFGKSMMLLVRASTGEEWNGLMADLASDRPGCTTTPAWDDPEPRGCGVSSAYPFFYSFTLLIGLCFLNLFVAVILEGFAESGDEQLAKLTREQLDNFSTAWAELDPYATMFIPSSKLTTLLRALEPPLGFARQFQVSDDDLRVIIIRLELPAYAGTMVHFSDVVMALAKRVMALAMAGRAGPGALAPEPYESAQLDLPEDHEAHVRWATKMERELQGIGAPKHEIQHYYAASAIANTFLTFRLRWRLGAALSAVEEAYSKQQQQQQGGGSSDGDDDPQAPQQPPPQQQPRPQQGAEEGKEPEWGSTPLGQPAAAQGAPALA